MLFCLGAFGLYGFMFCYLLGSQQNHSGFERHIQFDAAIWVFLISVFFLHEKLR